MNGPKLAKLRALDESTNVRSGFTSTRMGVPNSDPLGAGSEGSSPFEPPPPPPPPLHAARSTRQRQAVGMGLDGFRCDMVFFLPLGNSEFEGLSTDPPNAFRVRGAPRLVVFSNSPSDRGTARGPRRRRERVFLAFGRPCLRPAGQQGSWQ